MVTFQCIAYFSSFDGVEDIKGCQVEMRKQISYTGGDYHCLGTTGGERGELCCYRCHALVALYGLWVLLVAFFAPTMM